MAHAKRHLLRPQAHHPRDGVRPRRHRQRRLERRRHHAPLARRVELKVSGQPRSPRVPTADELARAIVKLIELRSACFSSAVPFARSSLAARYHHAGPSNKEVGLSHDTCRGSIAPLLFFHSPLRWWVLALEVHRSPREHMKRLMTLTAMLAAGFVLPACTKDGVAKPMERAAAPAPTNPLTGV